MINTFEQLIESWVHVSSNYPRAALWSSDQGATAGANFLGYDSSDPAAQGIAIYEDPKNLPTAIACILNRAQNRADFHPAIQKSSELANKFNQYINELNNTPFIQLNTPITKASRTFNTSDYNVLFNQIVSVYHGITKEAKNRLKQSIANMANAVFGSDNTEAWKNIFMQSTIDYSDPKQPKIYFYSTKLHMKKITQKKSEVVEQSYEVTGRVYTVLTTVIRKKAAYLADLDKKNVDDWLSDNTTREKAKFNACFQVEPYEKPVY